MLVLYKRIKQRREELNISQDELAKKVGYKSRSSINKIEKGLTDIPQSKIIDFARALDTTPEYLMGWESKNNTDDNLPELTAKDEREIESDLEDMMHSVASAACEGDDDFEDIEAFKATIKAAMIQAKRIAKKKYTPKKYRKK